ncbi:sirohydrochlorin chelatase [Streptomyces sp. AJS327]|uniref:sirohydrochlorin chelatase n=1 Tax=Streptomyces sp. AJS327 TaxID=2545265 RepID=UPI0015DFCC64|nr:sirohydrochlorin chelatase [Streptomyces sp. AJS327]MBA0050478.1 sirohydrochlorin chelatase [Streptomyces sp. AJS327]
MTAPPALLLVGSGTRDSAEAAAFRSLVEELGEHSPRTPVAGGFVSGVSPTLGEALDELVEGGAGSLTAVPLSLAPGRADAPEALAREALRHPEVEYTCARALGGHSSLLPVLERRLEEALDGVARTANDRADTWVLLVGPGSSEAEANAEVLRTTRLLWEGSGYAGVEAAFASVAAPDVTSGLDRCHRLGARRIVVLPYLLFAGAATQRLGQQLAGWSAVHPDTEVREAAALAPARELVELVWERYREAAAGAGGGATEGAAEPGGSHARIS